MKNTRLSILASTVGFGLAALACTSCKQRGFNQPGGPSEQNSIKSYDREGELIWSVPHPDDKNLVCFYHASDEDQTVKTLTPKAIFPFQLSDAGRLIKAEAGTLSLLASGKAGGDDVLAAHKTNNAISYSITVSAKSSSLSHRVEFVQDDTFDFALQAIAATQEESEAKAKDCKDKKWNDISTRALSALNTLPQLSEKEIDANIRAETAKNEAKIRSKGLERTDLPSESGPWETLSASTVWSEREELPNDLKVIAKIAGVEISFEKAKSENTPGKGLVGRIFQGRTLEFSASGSPENMAKFKELVERIFGKKSE